MATELYTFDDAGSRAEEKLASLGIPSGVMPAVCKRGLGEYKRSTPYHAPGAGGTFCYHEIVSTLREMLGPEGWDPSPTSMKLALAINPETGVAIAVSSGDDNTGKPDRMPSFRHPKGPATKGAVESNAKQLSFYDLIPDLDIFDHSGAQMVAVKTTWWLLFIVDEQHGEMRAELSLPIEIDGEVVSEWRERIILTSIPFDDQPDVARPGVGPSGPVFEINVSKKA